MPNQQLDPRTLDEATIGRLGEHARALLAGLWGQPQASAQLPRRLRACRLWSRQRRLLRELSYSCIRRSGRHQRGLRARGWTGEDAPWACWLAELVDRGLSPERAGVLLGQPVFGAPWVRPEGWTELAAEGALDEALLRSIGSLEEARGFVLAQLDRAPLTLRSKDRDRLAGELEAAGLSVRPARWAPSGLQVEGSPDLSPWAGRFQIQDEASQLVAELVAPGRRSLVVDYCAGAGGKSLALLDAAPKGMRLLACDPRERSLKEARRRAGELGLRLQTAGYEELEAGSAARVLVDAPCTGSGTLRRDPALRWRLDLDLVEHHAGLQRELLDRASELVKPGGRLVYATCSLLPAENEQQVAAFLERHPRFAQVDIAEILGRARASELGRNGQLHMSPAVHGSDGFFAAVLALASP
jgi:16S rRNA (cytosine967-C5)-methyltransferase